MEKNTLHLIIVYIYIELLLLWAEFLFTGKHSGNLGSHSVQARGSLNESCDVMSELKSARCSRFF